MNRSQANRQIYIQGKNLLKTYKINPDQNVYIHWKNEKPVVLPEKEIGIDYITTVKLKSIHNKQCCLTA